MRALSAYAPCDFSSSSFHVRTLRISSFQAWLGFVFHASLITLTFLALSAPLELFFVSCQWQRRKKFLCRRAYIHSAYLRNILLLSV